MEKLIQEDCLKVNLESDSIDLIITSPPYFNAKEYSQFKTYDDYFGFNSAWINLYFDKLKPGRMFCVVCSAVVQPRISRNNRSQRFNIPGDLHSIFREKYWFQEDIIWEKPEGAAKGRDRRFHLDGHPLQWRTNPNTEHILVYQKPCNFLNDKIINSYKHLKYEVKNKYERGEIWKINPETVVDHPAPFPLEIPFRLIQYYSWPNDVILDIFAGSGTTGIAAKRLDRKFILIENNSQYTKLIEERLKQCNLKF
jgi:DNA modification methylase